LLDFEIQPEIRALSGNLCALTGKPQATRSPGNSNTREGWPSQETALNSAVPSELATPDNNARSSRDSAINADTLCASAYQPTA